MSPHNSRILQIYPHIYPLWGIAFACVFSYSDFKMSRWSVLQHSPSRSSMSDVCASMNGKGFVSSKDGAC